MTIADVALLAGAFGIGTIVKGLIDRLLDRRKGRITEEQSAWERADAEARYRRKLEEALHETRRDLHCLGVAYEDMPAWPSRGTRPTE